MNGEVTNELRKIYRKAYSDGIWLLEFAPAYGGNKYLAAAGSISNLEKIEKQTGKEIDVSKLELGDVVNISLPGVGKTREESCKNAIKAWKEYSKQTKKKR